MNGILKEIYQKHPKRLNIVQVLRYGGNAKKITHGRLNSKVAQHPSQDARYAMGRKLPKGKTNVIRIGNCLRESLKVKEAQKSSKKKRISGKSPDLVKKSGGFFFCAV